MLLLIIFILAVILLSRKIVEPYRRLDMTGGESRRKCRMCGTYEPFKESKCPTVTYGSKFDYIAQKKDRTYGVPNGCQKIF